MLTNADRILAVLHASPGLSDGELRQRTGVDPHQRVNQICRRLAAEGKLRRVVRADGIIGNFPTRHTASSSSDMPPRTSVSSLLAARSEPLSLTSNGALLVLPCSAAKRRGGQTERSGSSVTDMLDARTARGLCDARSRLRTNRVPGLRGSHPISTLAPATQCGDGADILIGWRSHSSGRRTGGGSDLLRVMLERGRGQPVRRDGCSGSSSARTGVGCVSAWRSASRRACRSSFSLAGRAASSLAPYGRPSRGS